MRMDSPTANSRRMPRQRRSRVTYNLLLEATADILLKHGPDAINTNYVAARAGVSVGSLYQYFDSKETLLAELRAHHQRNLSHCYDSAFDRSTNHPLGEVLRNVIRAVVVRIHETRVLHLLLEDDVGLRPESRFPQAVQSEIGMQKIRAILEAYRDEIDVRDVDLASFVIGRTIRHVVNASLGNESGSGMTIEEVTDELVRFAGSYLLKRSGQPS